MLSQRAIDVACEMGACHVPAHNSDARVTDSEKTTRADEAKKYANDVAILNAHDHDSDGEQQVEPCALGKRPP